MKILFRYSILHARSYSADNDKDTGPCFSIKTVFPEIGIHIMKTRWPLSIAGADGVSTEAWLRHLSAWANLSNLYIGNSYR